MTLFFGVGTGRCGTMTLANLLNIERQVVCLHEGKIRRGADAAEQWLPFLTLQNLMAYHQPNKAHALFEENRARMPVIQREQGLQAFGDIAYNYAPFVHRIPTIFPDAKLIVLFRDGRDFVRSAYTAENPDPTPVGWLDERPLSKTERFISLGRLRPREGTAQYQGWQRMTPVEKNAWLWAETNRLILDGLAAWPKENVMQIQFETFFQDPLTHYAKLRAFLGLAEPMPSDIPALLERRINARGQFILDPWKEWDEATMSAFIRQAGPMMERLGYLSAHAIAHST